MCAAAAWLPPFFHGVALWAQLPQPCTCCWETAAGEQGTLLNAKGTNCHLVSRTLIEGTTLGLSLALRRRRSKKNARPAASAATTRNAATAMTAAAQAGSFLLFDDPPARRCAMLCLLLTHIPVQTPAMLSVLGLSAHQASQGSKAQLHCSLEHRQMIARLKGKRSDFCMFGNGPDQKAKSPPKKHAQL